VEDYERVTDFLVRVAGLRGVLIGVPKIAGQLACKLMNSWIICG
jgi:hypothetical protein